VTVDEEIQNATIFQFLLFSLFQITKSPPQKGIAVSVREIVPLKRFARLVGGKFCKLFTIIPYCTYSRKAHSSFSVELGNHKLKLSFKNITPTPKSIGHNKKLL
jgi:hypothetical protein